jgi:isoquinoline 1-oxidoreductase beta subunit
VSEGQPSRRAALKLGAAAGGSLVLGLHLPGCWVVPGPGAVARHGTATGELRPNAWLRITPDDRVIFTLDRVEMGQGTMTSHATLIAEELAIDPARITVELADASRDHDNPDPALRFQITGGSTSLQSSWEPLRRTGAAAREMLRQAAAAAWRVPLAECVAEGGAVLHRASGRRSSYGQLAGAAAQREVPDVALTPPERWRLIGRSVPRLDARVKVDGSGVYGIDVFVPGLVSAFLVRPPVRGGRHRRIDDGAVRRMRGVVDVVAIDEGVAVVADTWWRARRAAQELIVEWDEGGRAGVDSARLRQEYAELARRPGRERLDRGDAIRVQARAGRIIEALYELPYVAHAPLEPMNATAHVTGGGCEIWAPTQAPGIARVLAAQALGIDVARVTVHTTLIGGAFGRRIQQDFVVEAVKLSAALRRPVKVLWSREDDTAVDFYRPMATHLLRGTVDGKRITSWFHRVVSQSIVAHVGADFIGALMPEAMPRALGRVLRGSAPRLFRRQSIDDFTTSEGADDLPYRIADARVELTIAEPGVPVGWWRSVGHSHTAFAVEGFLDELAAAADRDPVELRLELLADAPRHRAVLARAAREAGWRTRPRPGVGRGVAVHESFGSVCAQVIEASVDDGQVRVHRVVCAVDCGRVVNPDLVRAQIESAVIYGLSAALAQEITFARGRVEQSNFHDFPLLRMHQCPRIEVHLVERGEQPHGVGEPGVPPVAPALCNAIFAATGKRVRRLPITAGLAEAA